MTHSEQREPTNEDLWAQPPADATSAYPGQSLAPVTPPAPAPHVQIAAPRADKSSFVIAIISLGVSIPLSIVALVTSSLSGLVIVWLGLVLLNFAFGWNRRPH